MFLAHRWRWEDGSEAEGIRTPLPITLAPGASCVAPAGALAPGRTGPVWLDLGVVEENVRWLSGDRRLDALVMPPPALPARREIRPRQGARIPRVVHRIWLGDAPMPDAHRRFGETWQELAPRLDGAAVDRRRRAHPEGHRARAQPRRAGGPRPLRDPAAPRGVYVDTDVECLRPLDDLLDGVAAFAAYEVPGRLCNAVLGATPGHAAFARASQLAAVTCGYGTYPEATATTFLTYVLEACDDVTLFGPERFYPRLWDGTRNVGDEPPYADHHWALSWSPEAAPRDFGAARRLTHR